MEQYKQEFIEFLAAPKLDSFKTLENAVFTPLAGILSKSEKYRNLS